MTVSPTAISLLDASSDAKAASELGERKVRKARPNPVKVGPLKVGELAKRAGKTVRALHLYEELGLLQPSVRSQGGFRLYEEAALERVQWISKLQEVGFSLSEIRRAARSLEAQGRESAPAAMAEVRGIFRERLDETRRNIARLKSLEGELQASLQYLQACRGCSTTTRLPACTTCEHRGEDEAVPGLVAGFIGE